ncbi:hypothetical protein GDO81_025201 [Engystomops pustulosus]|uniref:Uncharacterized protein n=1 Tax=Engystomops pustulosus TaxID=76066 RepID=A0AAV6Z222_ENGPU|nr:hypothetical protein GDO81_025201 [Engystomops pustulosus]
MAASPSRIITPDVSLNIVPQAGNPFTFFLSYILRFVYFCIWESGVTANIAAILGVEQFLGNDGGHFVCEPGSHQLNRKNQRGRCHGIYIYYIGGGALGFCHGGGRR